MTLDQLRAYRYHIRHPTEQGYADMAEVERFVNSIPKEYDMERKMISGYYIKGLTWREVSAAFYPNDEDNCRTKSKRCLIKLGVIFPKRAPK